MGWRLSSLAALKYWRATADNLRMNAMTWTLLAALVALPLATFGACHWWYQRKLAEREAHAQKLDKARQFTSEQVKQARKQIEKLQQEMAAMQARLSAAPSPRPAPLATPAADLPLAPSALDLALSEGDALHAKGLPSDGFADTQPMSTM